MDEFYPLSDEVEHTESTQLQSARFSGLLSKTFACREPNLDPGHMQAIRLFNGFYEGLPGLVVDLYGKTLVISDHAKEPAFFQDEIRLAVGFYQEKLPWIVSILLKERHSLDQHRRTGVLLFGNSLQDRILENEVIYAVDLRLTQDNSFYLDTRNLRVWLKLNMAGKTVLNCFAYTGALGIAALAGGARKVIQTDLSAKTLQIARQSAHLNKAAGIMGILALDFFKTVSRMKTSAELFDCLILDPPLFSTSELGKVDLLNNWINLINKARPLVGHEGWLITINNALFLSGHEVMDQLITLTSTPYVQIESQITVPEDVTGCAQTRLSVPPADPSPYNHPTKITILRITRKDGRRASDPIPARRANF